MIEFDIKTIIRFLEKINDSGNCWVWKAVINRDGYGMLAIKRKMVSAHRISYQLFKGEIGVGLQVDHLCRNRACVNPDHLETVTNQENAKRGITGMNNWQNKKTHCPKNHELKTPNLLPGHYKKYGWRICKICHNEKTKLYAQQKRRRSP